ncbi:MAG: hypothetical protein NXY57DRAFT_135164 [Lentinula lateritia]|nr:MAG: hypothetical protein NXY57DRAFT_135164 [Lentinula lateritia]
MTEQLAFSRITNQLIKSGEVLQFDTPKRRATFSGEIRWQEVLKNYCDLPSAIFPDNFPRVQGSRNSRFCFIDSKGQRHFTDIVLSDEYMLVTLPSETVANRPVWDPPAQPFVSLGDVSPPSDIGLQLPEGVGMEVDSRPSSHKSSPKKRGPSRSRNSAKKLCTARKHAAVTHSHTRLIGPTTRGNPQSERAPTLLTSFDLDFTTYDSSAVSSSSPSPSPSNVILNLKCWIDNCPGTFMSVGNLEAHHNMCHQGQTIFVCPFRDSCSHRTTKQGEMKRHIKSVQHLGGDLLLCPNGCSGKTFSRVDALRRHLKCCPNK